MAHPQVLVIRLDALKSPLLSGSWPPARCRRWRGCVGVLRSCSTTAPHSARDWHGSTLPPGFHRRQATTCDPPTGGRSINMLPLPVTDSVAVVAGRSADVWLPDLKRWGQQDLAPAALIRRLFRASL